MKSIKRYVQVAALQAVLTTLCLAPSCAGTTQTIKTWTGDFAGCEKADLGQYVTVDNIKMTLLAAIGYIIEGNTTALESEAAAILQVVGIDSFRCAVLATEQVLSPPTGSAAGSAAARIVPPGLVRLKAWLATQEAAAASGKATP